MPSRSSFRPDPGGFYLLEDMEDVTNRRVFVRADLDCPLDSKGALADDAKLHRAVPTLKRLIEQESQIVVAGHLGNPGGSTKPELSLEPCAARLAELLDVEVYLPEESQGFLARRLIHDLRPGRIVVLENLAFDARELRNDESLARSLLSGVEVFVGDCLAGPHTYSTIATLPRFCHERCMGLGMEAEVVAANRTRYLLDDGMVLLLGVPFAEAKPLLDYLLKTNVTICAGGALGTLFLAATGKLEATMAANPRELAAARTWLDKARDANVRVVLPVDVVCESPAAEPVALALAAVSSGGVIVDVGPETVELFSSHLSQASAAIMTGRMGRASGPSAATEHLVKVLAGIDGFSVVVSDPTLRPGEMLADAGRLGFISTAGNAFMALVCEQRLAGLEALRRPV